MQQITVSEDQTLPYNLNAYFSYMSSVPSPYKFNLKEGSKEKGVYRITLSNKDLFPF